MNTIPPHAYKGNLLNRFWSKVDKSGDCWLWTKSCDSKGYGHFYISSHPYGAHRIAYMLTYGTIPDGLGVLHRCDNPPCVRPDHLFLGTHADNMHDAKQKGRNSSPPKTIGENHWRSRFPERIAKGEKHVQAKFTNEQVRTIRARYQAGNISQAQLAKEYGVYKSCIYKILHYENYKEVM